MAGLGKQAKILTDKQVALALVAVATRRYPLRDRMIILLSVRAGLRAKEISNIRWSMVTDAQGAVTDTIHLVNGASKGKRGGREIPVAKDLRQALVELQAFKPPAPEDRIIFSERDIGISPKALAIWFLALYRDLGFKGASSHSGPPHAGPHGRAWRLPAGAARRDARGQERTHRLPGRRARKRPELARAARRPESGGLNIAPEVAVGDGA